MGCFFGRGQQATLRHATGRINKYLVFQDQMEIVTVSVGKIFSNILNWCSCNTYMVCSSVTCRLSSLLILSVLTTISTIAATVCLLQYNSQYIMENVDLDSSLWSSKYVELYADASNDLGL